MGGGGVGWHQHGAEPHGAVDFYSMERASGWAAARRRSLVKQTLELFYGDMISAGSGILRWGCIPRGQSCASRGFCLDAMSTCPPTESG